LTGQDLSEVAGHRTHGRPARRVQHAIRHVRKLQRQHDDRERRRDAPRRQPVSADHRIEQQRRHHAGRDVHDAGIDLQGAPGERCNQYEAQRARAMPIQQDKGDGGLAERRRDRRRPADRRQRHIERRGDDHERRRERDARRREAPRERDEQQGIGGRLDDRLAVAAGMRQIVEPRAGGHADGPHDPVVGRPDRVAADMRRRTDERQVVERPQRDPPVADLIAQQPEVRLDAADANREREEKQGGGGTPYPAHSAYSAHSV
jgi:hypothetical protein